VTAEIPGVLPQQSPKFWDVDAKKAKAMMNFYHTFPMNASIPGDNSLRLSVKNHNTLLGDTEIGHADIDLEDRWLSLARRAQRSTTNKDYLLDNVSCQDQPFWIAKNHFGGQEYETGRGKTQVQENDNKTCSEKKSSSQQAEERKDEEKKKEKEKKEEKENKRFAVKKLDADKPRGGLPPPSACFLNPLEETSLMAFKPYYKFKATETENKTPSTHNNVKIAPKLAPSQRLPVEIVDLLLEDEETGTEAKTGVLRLWVDMTLETEDYKPADLSTQTKAFEVRIVIKQCKNICVYKDIGERNDIFVKGVLRVKDFLGKEDVHRVETDVHKWANKEAMWNWRWVFNIIAPTTLCSLNLTLLDMDTMSDDDPIYDAKEYPLDHIMMLAWQARRDGEPNLGTLKEEILFDSWPEQNKQEDDLSCCLKCCSCRCCKKADNHEHLHRAAKLFVDITVMPQEDAVGHEVEDNVCIAPPKGRIDWTCAVKEPGKFIHVLLGPTLERRSRKFCCVFIVIFLLLVALAIFFFASQGLAGLDFWFK